MSCQIKNFTETVTSEAMQLISAMQKLKRELRACRGCLDHDTCLRPDSVDDQVNEMIAEINSEWEVNL